MAASKIIPKKSVVSKVPEPTALVPGEIAINYADKIIYGRHPSKSDTDPDAVVALGAPYEHSHDQLISLDPNTGGLGIYDLELTNTGEIRASDGAKTTTIVLPAGTISQTITLPNKTGTVALLDDITGGGGGGEADALISPDTLKKFALDNTGALNYETAEAVVSFSIPESSGTLGLRGGDTVISDVAPLNPYLGLRWIDSSIGRAFDWYVDPDGAGVWVETGVGSDGRQLSLRVSEGYIQWQYTGETVWLNLISLNELKGVAGVDGASAELRVTTSHIQWRNVGTETWNDLVSLEQITGPAGSDATVTLASINTALGFTPDNPTQPRTPTAHNHDERYYTETEVDEKLATKQASGSYAVQGHTHDAGAITSGVLDPARIPVFNSANQVVSSGGLSALTTSQEAEITTGSVVITSDGSRYIYKGSGAKTSATNYILLADITPTWDVITDKPAWITTFNPATATFSVSQIAGLATVATSGSYINLTDKPEIPAAQVSADWNATTGVARILNKPVLFSGDYNDLANKPEVQGAKTYRSSWDAAGLRHYIGSATVGTAENAANWTITRISTSAAGAVTATVTAAGAWTNRVNLFT